MSDDRVEIVVCPEGLVGNALALVLQDFAPEQHREIATTSQRELSPPKSLFVALMDGKLLDAAWGQLQPGNTAIFWPPRHPGDVGRELARAVVRSLDQQHVRMTQCVFAERTDAIDDLLETAGFEHLAELLYLSWTALSAIADKPDPPLDFETFQESQLPRFARLIEATYAETRDCPAMNGRRPMHEVLDGYRATGRFRPENWMFVRAGDDEVGVLLLAEYENSDYSELVYMGIVPKFRGHGFGREIARHAQRKVRSANVARLLVAVDAANAPALAMYEQAGFTVWNRRDVFVRFCQSVA